MSGHATAEVLSAYIDHELPRPQLRLVEAHLEECEECRRELQGLRRVVGKLHRLEALAPPPVLAQQVQRRISLDALHRGQPQGLVERIERRLGGLPLEPTVGVTFALIFSFAVILYLFGWWVNDRGGGTTILAPRVAAEGTPLEEVDGRLFELEGDRWVERGLDPEGPVRRLTVEQEEALELLEHHPRFVQWLVKGLAVHLQGDDGKAVLLTPPFLRQPGSWVRSRDEQEPMGG